MSTGPYVQTGPVEVALAMNSKGEVVLSGNYSQTIVRIASVGIGWNVGFEHVLHRSKRSSNSLFVIWEDKDGNSWEKQYNIGRPFKIVFNEKEWVREIKSDNNGNMIVVVQPRSAAPGYNDLRGDIRRLVEQWDKIHNRADRYWETDALHTVLQDNALQDQLEAVQTLKSKNCYWTIRELVTPRIVRFDVVRDDSLIVEVEKNWDMDLFCSGVKKLDRDGWFTARYMIKRKNGRWFITQKQVVE